VVYDVFLLIFAKTELLASHATAVVVNVNLMYLACLNPYLDNIKAKSAGIE